jgi:hypothetical protein
MRLALACFALACFALAACASAPPVPSPPAPVQLPSIARPAPVVALANIDEPSGEERKSIDEPSGEERKSIDDEAAAAVAEEPDDPPIQAAVERAPGDAIQQVVWAGRRRLARCYQNVLHTDPTMIGRLVVRFTIAAHGGVTDVRVDGPQPASFLACVAAVFQGLRFSPQPAGEVKVSYPVNVDAQ